LTENDLFVALMRLSFILPDLRWSDVRRLQEIKIHRVIDRIRRIR
jgi:hypothetical protein